MNSDLQKAIAELRQAEFFADLMERYQFNRSFYIRGAKERVNKASAEVVRLIKASQRVEP